MSRRDTVVVAVLINIGLLFVLFSTAVGKKDSPESTMAQRSTEQFTHTPIEQEIALPAIEEDEMDEVLNQFSQHLAKKDEPVAAPKQVEIPLMNESQHSERQVIVRNGDYLEKIAKENGVSVSEIMKLNRLPNTKLSIGQVLLIPADTEQVAAVEQPVPQTKPVKVASKPRPKAPEASNVEYYTIKRGDNPWLIALKYGIDLQSLLKINELDEKSARKLKPGDRIRIR